MLFNKNRMLVALAALTTIGSSLTAQDCNYQADCCNPCECNKIYISGFGGGTWSNSTKLRQTGVAFFPEETVGPLAVDARGHTSKRSTGFGGLNIGYEWSQCPISLCSNLSITTAAEVEAYWYSHKKKGHLINQTYLLDEHDFLDSFRLNVGVYLANVVFAINSCDLCGLVPYVGGGIGAVDLSARKADSLQTDPPEAGINHFNSKTNDSAWAFAAQAKAGLRYKIWDCASIFAEYRFLWADSSRFNFGATIYPTHVQTTTWNVDLKDLWYNSFAVGLKYDL